MRWSRAAVLEQTSCSSAGSRAIDARGADHKREQHAYRVAKEERDERPIGLGHRQFESALE